MGGKNKKHKAPGAAAMRAAVSASRARTAEAGAVGEAQSKKPVARPAPAVPTSAREPRVKQGQKFIVLILQMIPVALQIWTNLF